MLIFPDILMMNHKVVWPRIKGVMSYFKPMFEWLNLHNSLLHLLLKNGDFLNTDISQGSVATRLGCGGVFVYDLTLLKISY